MTNLISHLARVRSICVLALLAIVVAPPLTAQEQWRWEGVERQVVIPDVHGAFDEFAQLLQATGMVDEKLDWTGGETHLVSLGDLLDRGPDSRKAMDLLMKLEGQAAEAGGRVHVILGNHEELVLTGDLRYVSEAEYAAFIPDESEELRETAFEWFRTELLGGSPDSDGARDAFRTMFPRGYFGFRDGFASDGKYGSWLLGLPTIIVINNTAYVHAGLPELVAQMPLAELNERVSADLNGFVNSWESLLDGGVLPPFETRDPEDLADEALLMADPSRCTGGAIALCERLGVSAGSEAQVDEEVVAQLELFLDFARATTLSADGPMWYRGSVYCKPILEEPVLEAALGRLGVERVVVGHTPTQDRRAHSLYDGRLIMMDTGMLVSFYQGRPSALIVENGETTVFDLQSGERAPPLTGGQVIAGRLNRAAVFHALSDGEATVVEKPRNRPWEVRVMYEGQEVQALFYEGNDGELEQAAFNLDELMGLGMVPPTVTRRVDGKEGALQLWYSDAITENQRLESRMEVGGWCPIDPQFDLMSAFDLLTFNRGRSEDNVVWRRSLWNMYLTGHGEAFDSERRLPDRVSELVLAPGTVAALEALDEETLESVMDGLLNGRQIRSLLQRRDVILEETGSR